MSLTINELTVEMSSKVVVRGVSIVVQPGKLTAILGANGAGKSELVLAVAGMEKVIAGRVYVGEIEITNQAPDKIRARGVAAVPEGHQVLVSLTVDENLRGAGSLLDKKNLEETISKVYKLFPEMAERKSQTAGTMSGGQQQMLAIGHALMARPSYLLIDEMSLGLAPLIVKRLVKALEVLMSEGTGILLVEQFTDVALSIADTVTVLRRGEVCFQGAAEALQLNPELLEQAYL